MPPENSQTIYITVTTRQGVTKKFIYFPAKKKLVVRIPQKSGKLRHMPRIYSAESKRVQWSSLTIEEISGGPEGLSSPLSKKVDLVWTSDNQLMIKVNPNTSIEQFLNNYESISVTEDWSDQRDRRHPLSGTDHEFKSSVESCFLDLRRVTSNQGQYFQLLLELYCWLVYGAGKLPGEGWLNNASRRQGLLKLYEQFDCLSEHQYELLSYLVQEMNHYDLNKERKLYHPPEIDKFSENTKKARLELSKVAGKAIASTLKTVNPGAMSSDELELFVCDINHPSNRSYTTEDQLIVCNLQVRSSEAFDRLSVAGQELVLWQCQKAKEKHTKQLPFKEKLYLLQKMRDHVSAYGEFNNVKLIVEQIAKIDECTNTVIYLRNQNRLEDAMDQIDALMVELDLTINNRHSDFLAVEKKSYNAKERRVLSALSLLSVKPYLEVYSDFHKDLNGSTVIKALILNNDQLLKAYCEYYRKIYYHSSEQLMSIPLKFALKIFENETLTDIISYKVLLKIATSDVRYVELARTFVSGGKPDDMSSAEYGECLFDLVTKGKNTRAIIDILLSDDTAMVALSYHYGYKIDSWARNLVCLFDPEHSYDDILQTFNLPASLLALPSQFTLAIYWSSELRGNISFEHLLALALNDEGHKELALAFVNEDKPDDMLLEDYQRYLFTLATYGKNKKLIMEEVMGHSVLKEAYCAHYSCIFDGESEYLSAISPEFALEIMHNERLRKYLDYNKLLRIALSNTCYSELALAFVNGTKPSDVSDDEYSANIFALATGGRNKQIVMDAISSGRKHLKRAFCIYAEKVLKHSSVSRLSLSPEFALEIFRDEELRQYVTYDHLIDVAMSHTDYEKLAFAFINSESLYGTQPKDYQRFIFLLATEGANSSAVMAAVKKDGNLRREFLAYYRKNHESSGFYASKISEENLFEFLESEYFRAKTLFEQLVDVMTSDTYPVKDIEDIIAKGRPECITEQKYQELIFRLATEGYHRRAVTSLLFSSDHDFTHIDHDTFFSIAHHHIEPVDTDQLTLGSNDNPKYTPEYLLAETVLSSNKLNDFMTNATRRETFVMFTGLDVKTNCSTDGLLAKIKETQLKLMLARSDIALRLLTTANNLKNIPPTDLQGLARFYLGIIEQARLQKRVCRFFTDPTTTVEYKEATQIIQLIFADGSPMKQVSSDLNSRAFQLEQPLEHSENDEAVKLTIHYFMPALIKHMRAKSSRKCLIMNKLQRYAANKLSAYDNIDAIKEFTIKALLEFLKVAFMHRSEHKQSVSTVTEQNMHNIQVTRSIKKVLELLNDPAYRPIRTLLGLNQIRAVTLYELCVLLKEHSIGAYPQQEITAFDPMCPDTWNEIADLYEAWGLDTQGGRSDIDDDIVDDHCTRKNQSEALILA